MQTYKELYIGGEWVAPDGSDVIEVISPATEEVIGRASCRERVFGYV